MAKAQVVEGFIPGNNINAVRENVPGVVSIFVLPPRAPALRQTPKPTKGLLKDVFEYLLNRCLIGTELYVLSPEYVPMAVGVNVEVVDPETEQEILQAVQNTLVNYIWPVAPGGALAEGWGMGVTVRGSELSAQVARVPGVKSVTSLSIFSQKVNGKWRRLPESQGLNLLKYQLPELLGVSAGTGSGNASFPSGIEALGDSSGSGTGVPAPVIPETC